MPASNCSETEAGPGAIRPDHTQVAKHYARADLLTAIENGLLKSGKTKHTVTTDDLSPLDEFHIGGRSATIEILNQLHLSPSQFVLDIGCGLGGPARFVAANCGCRVIGIDITHDYVGVGNVLCQWLGLSDQVTLHRANALALPFPDELFDATYMLHVGMNIADKASLFKEIARVLRPGSLFAIYDVMKTSDGEISYPVPWATTSDACALGSPQQYRAALDAAGFDILSQRTRRDFALAYFSRQRTLAGAHNAPALGLHILMGERRANQIRNMTEAIGCRRISPVEMIAKKRSRTLTEP
jgi:ubiquinone/menaquinone biosynthesis C-methylase UbiE